MPEHIEKVARTVEDIYGLALVEMAQKAGTFSTSMRTVKRESSISPERRSAVVVLTPPSTIMVTKRLYISKP